MHTHTHTHQGMSRLCTKDQTTEEMSYEDIVLTTHTHQGMSRLCTEDQSTEEMSYEDIVLTTHTHTPRYVTVVYKGPIN